MSVASLSSIAKPSTVATFATRPALAHPNVRFGVNPPATDSFSPAAASFADSIAEADAYLASLTQSLNTGMPLPAIPANPNARFNDPTDLLQRLDARKASQNRNVFTRTYHKIKTWILGLLGKANPLDTVSPSMYQNFLKLEGLKGQKLQDVFAAEDATLAAKWRAEGQTEAQIADRFQRYGKPVPERSQ